MLTHLDAQGRASMVDVTDKAVTHREAVAESLVRMRPQTLELIQSGGHPKGDVMAVARIAGIPAPRRNLWWGPGLGDRAGDIARRSPGPV